MIELAALMETQGNLEVAKAIYTTTIKRMQATLGEGHIKALETIRLFALLLERHQQYKDATK
jgi:predicted KAP-like P-loop ATPase